jgi:hypothetical protein
MKFCSQGCANEKAVGMITKLGWPRTVEGPLGTRIPIYDGPVVKLFLATEGLLAPYHPIIVSKYGDMLIEPTDFLRVKRAKSRRKSAATAHQYARMLVDMLFLFDAADNGNGIDPARPHDLIVPRSNQVMKFAQKRTLLVWIKALIFFHCRHESCLECCVHFSFGD